MCFFTYDNALDFSHDIYGQKYEFAAAVATRSEDAEATRDRVGRGEEGKATRKAEASRGRFGRGEQGEARPGNSVPRGGPQLELSRRQLKTWSKSDPSASLLNWALQLFSCKGQNMYQVSIY